MTRFIKLLFLPSFLSATALAIWIAQSGYSHTWLLFLFAIAVLLSFLAESYIPYNTDFNDDHGDTGRDVVHALVNEISNIASLVSGPALALALGVGVWWPDQLPFWLQCLGAILFADLGITIAHYFSHKWRFLWRFHAVHHSVKRMYGFNGLMKHPLHQAIEGFFGVMPLIVLGLPLDVGMVLLFAIAMQLLLQHSNADYWVGPLRTVLAINQVHRFHHLKDAARGDVNFGLFTTLWDRLLGTHFYDRHASFTEDDLGIGSDPTYPRAYLPQLLAPFVRPVK